MILRMLIPNPDLDFKNLDPKTYFWANLGPKTQSCPFCLKISTHGISRMLILISFFGIFGPKKSTLSVLTENWYTWYFGIADSKCGLRFLKFRLPSLFLGKFGPKKLMLSSLAENWHTECPDDANSYSDISEQKFFVSFQP